MKPQRKYSRLHLTWEYALQRGARGCLATQAPGSRPAPESPLALSFDAGNPGAHQHQHTLAHGTDQGDIHGSQTALTAISNARVATIC